MTAQRQPAIRKTHPAEDLPERPLRSEIAPIPSPAVPASTVIVGEQGPEGLTMTHNTRIRPSLKARLRRGVDKLRYETGDRTISEASLTDKALEEYLDKHGL